MLVFMQAAVFVVTIFLCSVQCFASSSFSQDSAQIISEARRHRSLGESALTGELQGQRKWLYMLQNADVPIFVSEGNSKSSATEATRQFQYLTIDYSRDGGKDGPSSSSIFSREDITKIREAFSTNSSSSSSSPLLPASPKRIILSFLSIGEAETYRFYYKKEWETNKDSRPSWLSSTENKEWKGNQKVRYWDPEWQAIVFQSIDKIIDAGFDGVYLDIIDAYLYWSDPAQLEDAGERGEDGKKVASALTEEECAKRMIAFIKSIKEYGTAKLKKSDENTHEFLVFPQNGEGILQYDASGDYMNSISGIGVEDLWYNFAKPNGNDRRRRRRPIPAEGVSTTGDSSPSTSSLLLQHEKTAGRRLTGFESSCAEETESRLQFLRQIKSREKVVLVVEYIVDDNNDKCEEDNLARVKNFLSNSKEEGFIPFVARIDRALDRVVTTCLSALPSSDDSGSTSSKRPTTGADDTSLASFLQLPKFLLGVVLLHICLLLPSFYH